MKDILGKVRDILEPWRKGSSPLEIRRAILDDVESRVIAVGDGRRLLPINHLRVHLLTPDPDDRQAMEAVVREAWDLKEEIAGRLRDRGCPIPAGLDVEVVFDEEPDPRYGERRFFVEYGKREGEAASPEAAPETARPTLELTVLKGTATQRVYEFETPRIYLGRLQEVVDADGRVRRRNDVAFKEEGEVNTTVSREHARITWDGETGGFWLRAEQNASGTRIYRTGQTIDVSAHDRRGVRLQAGDEVHLGRACVKVGFR
jgi:pSer/pThr/pTyr-binding forkhead associated (FHA) protein